MKIGFDRNLFSQNFADARFAKIEEGRFILEIKEDNFRIEPKDAYERAWACRDFEFSHLWQRSVFLAVFLLAIAGAYGSLLLNMYFPSEQNQIFIWNDGNADWKENTATKRIEYKANDITWQQHAIASGVCWLGITFSILWVMMAKGSKYWSERYEMTIWDFENEKEFGENLQDVYHHGKLAPLKSEKCDENIFSTKAGHYSVSKINATIGIIGLVAFSFLAIFHFGKILHIRINSLTNLQYALFSISHWLFFGAILFALLRFLCNSGHLKEDEESRNE
ncbi:MAG: hypothetical protein IKO57_04250 [Treponema sp.]|nr:hypothetical protein [Treponema sp.]